MLIRRLLLALLVLAPAHLVPGGAEAQQRRPMTIEGTTTLYERVITRPGATLRPRPDATGRAIPGFSVFYVYARGGEGEAAWLEVGEGADGRTAGFIRADRAIPWRHTMVLAFTNPAGRDRALFFRDGETVREAWSAPDRAARGAAFRAAAESPDGTGPVIAKEPETFVDITRNFYLLPVLSARMMEPERGPSARLLEVISAPAREAAPRQSPEALRDFKGAVVFVVDTTISMEPYIARTREAIARVVKRIGDTAVRDNFRFGMVAYRGSTAGRPRLEYVTRLVAAPDFREAPDALLRRVEGVREAEVSSGAFDEDALAGITTALDEVKWSEFGGRYVVLITDAGAREPPDPAATTGLTVENVRTLARSEIKQVAIYAIHLQTPEGRENHAKAERQYRTLTDFPGVGPLYYPVPEGRVEDFGAVVDTLADAILAQVAQTVGRPIAGIAPAQGAQPSRIAEETAVVAHAMRLSYLGRANAASVPDVVRSFTVDEDWTNPSPIRRPVEVRVLLTRNQLSDLAATLRGIIEAGTAGRLAPETFFGRLRGLAAALSRDPRRIAELQRVAGVFGEYLEGLPYRSAIMGLSEDEWVTMGAGARREIINGLSSKLRLYETFARQPELWVNLDGARNPNEAMYPVPLSALP
ncbi:vWA domain-containing protein [Elioraea sp.]|uniref:vWA domain-containing protein n=1 Tax=Elioraea sp. TaxID=2185103 RepID=UPI0025C15831|nr:vWA domain-containing protein [Elioraea sp.]